MPTTSPSPSGSAKNRTMTSADPGAAFTPRFTFCRIGSSPTGRLKVALVTGIGPAGSISTTPESADDGADTVRDRGPQNTDIVVSGTACPPPPDPPQPARREAETKAKRETRLDSMEAIVT